MKLAWLGENTVELSGWRDNVKDQIDLERHLLQNINGLVRCLYVSDAITLVYKDGSRIDFDQIESVFQGIESKRGKTQFSGSTIIPVCYDQEFALDRTILEEQLQLPFEKIVELHLQSALKASMYGFMPGFCYLKGLDQQISIPRKSTPLKRIPKGSVAIANNMCGIYPNAGPGGWHIIGRTPVQLFDPTEENPFFIPLGGTVEFKSISKSEYDHY